MSGPAAPPEATGRPDPDTAANAAEFVAALRRLRQWSGLSYRELAKRASAAGDALPRSTVTAAMTRTALPREDLVAALARTCGCDKEEVERWVSARRRIAAAPARTAPAGSSGVPAQLPPPPSGFVGRAAHLADLDARLDRSGAAPTVLVTAIGGTAGVGKTALAVHWARRIAHRYPDGQLYVNLRGFDPTGEPVAPAEALGGFLDAFDIPAGRIPDGVAARTARFRSLLAGRRVLVVLDNARDAEQVRPLLPGEPGCLAVVTSRHRLDGLVATDGAYPVTLPLLSTVEARELLVRRLGAARVAAEPDAVDQIVAHCAGLPLGLAIVAARAATRPDFPLAVFAAQLCGARSRLDAFGGDDPAADLRAVFSWSYQALGPEPARLFRLLGVHPGPDAALPALAALAGGTVHSVRPLVTELVGQHLVTEHRPGRYECHDLLRAYATELSGAANDRDDGDDRDEALSRLLDHYLHTAYRAARLLDPHRGPLRLPGPVPGAAPEDLATADEALGWLTAEHPVLLRLLVRAQEWGSGTHPWQLAWTLGTFVDRRGNWAQWADTLERALGDGVAEPEGQTYAYHSLARAYARLGRFADAREYHLRVLDLLGVDGDPARRAHTELSLSYVLDRLSRPEEGLDRARRALDLYHRAGHEVGEANARNAVGWFHVRLGEYAHAVDHCEESLRLLAKLGDRHGQASTLDSLGHANHLLGRYADAISCYDRALVLFRDTADRYNEADTLTRLGDAWAAYGEPGRAQGTWRDALAILDELDHPDAAALRGRLSTPAREGSG